MATTELKCEKHRTPTHLTCAQCGKPSCTKCLVWTEVGQKCRDCVPSKAGAERSVVVPLAVVAVLVVALLAVLGTFSRGSSDETVAERGNQGRTQPGIGQPARDGALTFVVTSFECGPEEVGFGDLKKTANGRYCILVFKATNTSSRPTAFSPARQTLLDAQRRQFGWDGLASALYRRGQGGGDDPQQLLGTQQLNPSAVVETTLLFDVPDGVNPEMVELHGGGGTLGATVRLTEPAARIG